MNSTAETKCWYENGLEFKCRGCGTCCRGPGGYVWLTIAEAEAISAHMGMEMDAFARKYLRRTGLRLALVDGEGGDCILLDKEGGCKAYELRPTQCRTYPWWPEVVATRNAWEQEKSNCAGIGQGRLYTIEEIEEQRKLAAEADKEG